MSNDFFYLEVMWNVLPTFSETNSPTAQEEDVDTLFFALELATD
jgi:hypothetical protein